MADGPQSAWSSCSGVLVSLELIRAAGHCRVIVVLAEGEKTMHLPFG